MTKIILFGSNGMLGNCIKKYIELKCKYELITINREEYDAFLNNFDDLEKILISKNINDDTVVVNAIGVIPQASKDYLLNDKMYIKVNSLFPNILSNLCQKYNAKMIHATTDCVFSGKDGNYYENSIHDADTIYAITKSLGEPSNCTVIRTSIIGEEEKNKRSLLEWVRSNIGGVINGYTNHYWNGITCLEFAKIIDKIIKNRLYWDGVRHIFSPISVSKYQLVSMINDIYNLNITINEFSTYEKCDKTLNTNYATNSLFNIPELKNQIIELKKFHYESKTKVSIVMAYYNRKSQLLFTLKTIDNSEYKNIEVIIIDDASDLNQQLDDIVNNYQFKIKYVKIDKSSKKVVNPCVLYNMGFKIATGDIIIIQNPECCHIGDIISFVVNNISENNYFSFACTNLFYKHLNNILYKLYQNNDSKEKILSYIKELPESTHDSILWYNHINYRPCGYHFTSAICKTDLDKLGGFDERYAFGSGYDDNEFVERIKHCGINLIVTDETVSPFCIHQWHEKSNKLHTLELVEKNRVIFNEHMKELGINKFYDRI